MIGMTTEWPQFDSPVNGLVLRYRCRRLIQKVAAISTVSTPTLSQVVSDSPKYSGSPPDASSPPRAVSAAVARARGAADPVDTAAVSTSVEVNGSMLKSPSPVVRRICAPTVLANYAPQWPPRQCGRSKPAIARTDLAIDVR